jgi:hypothetical protein
MRAMKWFLVSLALAGCAKAGPENRIIGGVPYVTLSQTTSEETTPDNSFGCTTCAGFTCESSYYRVFELADYGITTILHVTQVEFGIQTAAAGVGGQQAARVQVGAYGMTSGEPTLDLAQIRPIASADIQIPDGSDTRMIVPIAADVAPDMSMIVELLIPDGSAAGNKFFIGSNELGEHKPGYTRSPDCGYPSPTTMFSVASDRGAGETDIVITVSGTP